MAESCPSREELSAFHLGKLTAGALETVAEHLSACETCPAILEALSDGADPLLSELRKPVETEILSATECERVVDLVEKIGAQLGAMPTAFSDMSSALSTQSRGHATTHELGQYQLLEKLGEGGMGQVFKARHQLMNRIVALKVINKKHLNNPEAVLRFHREIRALAQLDHPNIVRAHDADQVDDRHFLVMEHIEGTNLAKLVRQQGPLPVAQACAYIQQAAAGLQHAHEHGLVHRDIKPSNLIVTPTGLIKVLDLGLAKLREEQPVGDELTAAGKLMGTLDYMAPEQWEDTHAVDIRADIYSLGCTLYHLLTGKPPFGGPEYNSALKKMKAHAEASAPPIRERRPEVPEVLAAVVHRMLAKDPAQRYATPAEVSAALQPFTTLTQGEMPSTETWAPGTATAISSPITTATAGNRFRRAWRRACRKRPILNRVRLRMALATIFCLLVAVGLSTIGLPLLRMGHERAPVENAHVALKNMGHIIGEKVEPTPRPATSPPREIKAGPASPEPAEPEDFDQVIAQATAAIRRNPNDAAAYLQRAEAYFFKMHMDKVIHDSTDAIRLDPKCAAAHAFRGGALADQRNYDKALADCNEALRLDPQCAAAYSFRAFVDCSQGAYSQGLAECNQALQINPREPLAYYFRGCAYSDLGKYELAMKDLSQAIQLKPRFVAPYSKRGEVFVSYKEDYDSAIDEFADAIHLCPGWYLPYYNRAGAYFKKKNYERAINDYSEALRLNPRYAKAFHERGWVYLSKGNYQRAIVDCDQAIQLDDQNVGAYNIRGWALVYMKDYDRAVANFQEGVQLFPKDPWLYVGRGCAYYLKEEYDPAIADFNKAVELNPQYADAYFWRSKAYEEKGERDRAKSDYETAIKLDPGLKTNWGPQVVRIVKMRIGHYRGDPPKSLGDIGVDSFATQVEDDVKVRAELSRPAYCYLIAYNPDGKEQLCFPAAQSLPPTPVVKLEYPPDSNKYFGLIKKEGTGPQAFVLLASRKPLPAYTEWRKKAGRIAWEPAMYEGVLRFDGHGEPVQLADTRGEVRQRTLATKWTLDFFNFFRDRKDVDAVKVMVFPVKAKEEKKDAAKSKEKD